MLYKLQYTISRQERVTVAEEEFEAVDDSAAITEANRRFPSSSTSRKLFNIGNEIAL